MHNTHFFKALFEWPKAENERILRGKRLDALEKTRTNLNGIMLKNSWNAQPPFVNFGKVPSGFYVDVLAELQAGLYKVWTTIFDYDILPPWHLQGYF